MVICTDFVLRPPSTYLMKNNGWISTVRKMKNWAFAELQTGDSPRGVQVIMSPKQAQPLGTGACVEITGKLQPKGNGSPGQELLAETVTLLGASGPEFPLQKKFHRTEFIRHLPQFRWRTRTNAQVLRYRSWAMSQLTSYFDQQKCFQVNSPIITSSDCEGAGEVFEIKGSKEFFGTPAYLSVSSQLHLEVFCQSLGRVWNMTPAFRAEESDTNRHLSEFWMVEAELAFIELSELLDTCESMVKSLVPSGKMADDLLLSKRDLDLKTKIQTRWDLLKGEWTRITYTDAVTIIKEAVAAGKLDTLIEWGDGLASEHEKYLSGEHFKTPVFVTDYPRTIKPFYMKGSTDSGKTVSCFDLLIPEIGELVGGSMREDDLSTLLKNMNDNGMDPENMEWYTDLRKYGTFPHGGYGLGFERLIMYVCGLDNIRDAAGFIRHFGALTC